MSAFLFIFDFDGCITDWDEELSTNRADRLAYAMNYLLQFGKIEIISMANHAHIDEIVRQSGSPGLIKIFDEMSWSQWNTIENREHLTEIDPLRKESEKRQRAMIRKVMKSEHWQSDMDCIRAYKKTNALLILAKKYRLKPDHIFFFDDNVYNVIFARSEGFRAELINNHPAMFELNLRTKIGAITRKVNQIQKKNS